MPFVVFKTISYDDVLPLKIQCYYLTPVRCVWVVWVIPAGCCYCKSVSFGV